MKYRKKDFLKLILIIVVGLIVAIIVYPFLHEMGHTVAALMIGTEIADVRLFPLPSTLCLIDTGNKLQIIVVGFGGIILPFLVTIFIPTKRFLIWYLWFLIKGSCVLSFILSIWAILFYRTKLESATDDMSRVMQFAPEYKWYYIIVIMVFLLVSVMQILRSQPLDKCMKYFDL